MPIKKSELYSSLWKSCDELLGGMDASKYKGFVPIWLFVKHTAQASTLIRARPLQTGEGGRKLG